MRTFVEKKKPGRQNKSPNPKLHENVVRSIPALQQTIGNQAVQRLLDADMQHLELKSGMTAITARTPDFNQVPLRADTMLPRNDPGFGSFQTRTTVERYPFRATIRREAHSLTESNPTLSSQPQTALERSDAGPGQERGGEQYQALFERLGTVQIAGEEQAGPAVSTAEPIQSGVEVPAEAEVPAQAEAPAAPTAETAQTGVEVPAEAEATAEAAQDEAPSAPIHLPDIEIPALAEVEKTDAVKGGFTYSGSIVKGGATPSGFGVTRSFDSKLTGVTITPKASTFEVAATYEHPITYQIRSGTGPERQKDIASETDSNITKTNYPKVVTDLTPDMSDLNGRPPRTKFWAEDLTTRHELVHADDDKGNGPAAMTTVTTWLNTKTAANAGEVTTLLGALPGRFASALLAALSTEDGEKHAYGDGADSYKARANAIKAKGVKGDYA